MANTRVPVATLFGGVSTQPDSLRHANQVASAQNTLLTVRNGMSKRPGSEMLIDVDAVTALASDGNYRLHAIHRDAEEIYLVIYGDSTLRIFDLDGTEAAIKDTTGTAIASSSEDAKAYLDANDAVADDMRLVTVADYTLLTNTTVDVAPKQAGYYSVDDTYDTYSEMMSKPHSDGEHLETTEDNEVHLAGKYLFDADGDGFGTWTSAVLTSSYDAPTDNWDHPTDYNPGGVKIRFQRYEFGGSTAEFTNSDNRLTQAGLFVNDRVAAGDTILVVAAAYTVASVDPNGDWIELAISCGGDGSKVLNEVYLSYDIQWDFSSNTPTTMKELGEALNTALHEAGCENGGIYWSASGANDYLNILSPFRGTSAGIYDIANHTNGTTVPPGPGQVRYFGQTGMPFDFSAGTPTTANGTGSPTTRELDLEDRITKVTTSGAKEGMLDETTMPIQITRESVSPLEFKVDVIDWSVRFTGGDATNPIPSLWQKNNNDVYSASLTDLCFHRNRLVLGGDENIIFSQAGDFFNLYLEDSDNIGDADPIDTALSTDRVTLVDYLIPFRKTLVVFTKAGRQFELNAPETLTPNTAAITPSTAYQSMANVRPAMMGSSIFFMAEKQEDSAEMREYFYDDTQSANIAADVTSHCEGYLPADIKTICPCPNNDTVLVLPADGALASGDVGFYVYRDMGVKDKKIQSAWCEYTFEVREDSSERICDIVIIGSYAYMLIESNEGYIITRLSIPDDKATTGWDYPVRLDNRVTKTGVYAGGWTTWTLDVPDATLDTAVLGPAFGSSAGTVLSLNRVHASAYKTAGDYSAGDVQLGRGYTMRAVLSRPYIRSEDGSTILDGTVRIHKFITNHKDTGEYTLQVEHTRRASSKTRSKTFTPTFDLIEPEGSFQMLVKGRAVDATLSISSTSPKPCIITAAEYVCSWSPRSM